MNRQENFNNEDNEIEDVENIPLQPAKPIQQIRQTQPQTKPRPVNPPPSRLPLPIAYNPPPPPNPKETAYISSQLSTVIEQSSWVSDDELKEMEEELERSGERGDFLRTPGGGIRMTGMMTLDELFE